MKTSTILRRSCFSSRSKESKLLLEVYETRQIQEAPPLHAYMSCESLSEKLRADELRGGSIVLKKKLRPTELSHRTLQPTMLPVG